MRLSQARDKRNKNTAVLGSLVVEIMMGDFYQFFSMIGRLLWIYLVIAVEIYGKGI